MAPQRPDSYTHGYYSSLYNSSLHFCRNCLSLQLRKQNLLESRFATDLTLLIPPKNISHAPRDPAINSVQETRTALSQPLSILFIPLMEQKIVVSIRLATAVAVLIQQQQQQLSSLILFRRIVMKD